MKRRLATESTLPSGGGAVAKHPLSGTLENTASNQQGFCSLL